MRRRLRCLLPILALALGACTGKPLPAERGDYAGTWRGDGVELRIDPDGTVSYRRQSGNGTVSIDGPLQGFDGDDFVVGVMVVKTTFDVEARPQQQGGRWVMTVDGVELVRDP